MILLSSGREQRNATTTNRGSFGENLCQKEPRAVLGEPHQNIAQPNGTLQTTGATQWWPKTNTEHSWEEPPPEATKGDPRKNLHQNAQPNDQTTRTIREDTAASRTVEATQ
ncbi:hypothetical protein Taro_016890, partial [Colocasia esculenta]|nr:hypothetical protein [Colocasia esculenta]